MKTVGIIQARMSSTRLPGKVLADVGGKPMLWHVTQRAQAAKTLDQIVLATSNTPDDDAVEAFCDQNAIACFRGSRDDVLDRYYQAARHFNAEVVVRLTADCPLLDPEVIDKIVAAFHEGDYDYVSNSVERSFPDGLDTEVFSREALERAWREARLMSEREHVTPYIWKNPDLFRVGSVVHSEDLSALRWTVDEPQDLEFVRAIHAYLGILPFSMTEAVHFLREHPELAEINRGFKANEGYRESLREDSLIDLLEER